MLRRRILSACILIPVVLLLLYRGGPYLTGFVAACGALMGWEWGRMRAGGRIDATALLAIVLVPLGIVIVPVAGFSSALAVLGAGAALSLATAWRGGAGSMLWAAVGLVYIGLPCLALLWLRDEPDGWRAVLWLLAVVWAADSGAYLAGRTIGGPRLVPAISPNKTWAGLGGAVVAGAVLGVAVAIWAEARSPALAALAGGVVGVVEQLGDLLESAVKRHFRVKDTSALIPGHGGVLDRVDGLMLATMLLAFVSVAGGGGVLTW